MKTNYSRLIPAPKATACRRLSAFAGAFVILLAVFSNEASARPALTISFADGGSVILRSDRDRFYPVGLYPGETATIQLVIPRGLANTPLTVEPLDGGAVTQNVVIAADGTASIAFQAGIQPGLYRIMAAAAGKTAILQFWVLDPQNPEGNPPVIIRTPAGS